MNQITEFRTGNSIRLGFKEGSSDNFIGVENGSFVIDQDLSKKYEWVITLNKDLSFCFKSKTAGCYLGVDQQCLNVVLNNNPHNFKVLWRSNGKISLMSHMHCKQTNINGKEGPLIGFNSDGYLIGNADIDNCIQWDIHPAKLPSPPSNAAKLLSNYNKHLEMWRGSFSLVQKPTKRVKAELATTFSYPNANIKKWVMILPAPPSPTQTQTILSARYDLYDCRGVNMIAQGTMINTHAHYIFRAVAENPPPDATKTVISKCIIEAQLSSIKLTKGPAQAPVAPLPDHVKRYHMLETPKMNYKDPVFKEWLNTHHLHPMLLSDGSYEPILCYAYRVFMFIKVHFNYIYPVDDGRKATDSILTRSTDCGGFSILFSSVMRAHGIPSKLMFGHWAQSGIQYHVKGEFYVNGLGWVPFDMAAGVGDNHEPFTYNFGQDTGEFITLHFDDDIKDIHTTIHNTNQRIDWGQLPCFWIHGEGPFTNLKFESDWKVV
ncbi:hypothetical protein CYY_002032 [Polysphondylium violaceum]|uniref:Transglutaminase-like domain-containing protein n=1 Tax=Polysphondylium violaceum TaxID=133409 RepID=A0A8J4Q1Z8_9MYCE|nr:hypothetical protein CYY_002032 [Polysphondylium violaceum]